MTKKRTTLATTKSMLSLKVAHKDLCNQPEDLPHLMLVTAPAGGGKTTALDWLARDIGAIYIRALATDSAVAFLSRLMNACGLSPNCTRGNSVMTLSVADHLAANERTLIVDEGDHLFSSARLIETLRDIHDMSGMPLIIAGHTGLERRMANKPQLYSRVTQWLEFPALDIEDLQQIARKNYGITVDDDLLKFLLQEARGNLRLARVGLERVSKFADGNNHRRVTLDMWGKRKFYLTHQSHAA